MFWAGITPRDVASITGGRAAFGLAVVGPVIFFLYRFDPACPWSDAPYSIHLVPEEERALPGPALASGAQTAQHALLNVVLVEATNGIVRGLRAITFSPRLTTALHLAIRDQLAAPWSAAAYDAALADAYRRHPTTRSLVDAATVIDRRPGRS